MTSYEDEKWYKYYHSSYDMSHYDKTMQIKQW